MNKLTKISLGLIVLLIFIIPAGFAADNCTDIVGEDNLNDDIVSDVDEIPVNEYYFDVNSDTDGNGTKDNPYKVFNQNRVPDNSIIHLATGEYKFSPSKTFSNVSFYGMDSLKTTLNLNRNYLNVNDGFCLQNLTLRDGQFNLGSSSDFKANNVIFEYVNGVWGYNFFKGVIYGKDSTITLDNCNFSNINNSNMFYGGVIYSYDSILNINNSQFVNTYSYQGGAIFGTEFYGKCEINIRNSKFINNTAVYGGAIYTQNGCRLDIENCEFINDSSTSFGGAIAYIAPRASDARFSVKKSKFINDRSVNDAGGAIYSKFSIFEGDNLTIGNCSSLFSPVTLLQSSSTLNNIYGYNNTAVYDGGVIYQMYGDLALTGSTFENNAAKNGGAVFAHDIKNLLIRNNVFNDNHATLGQAIYCLLSDYTGIYDNTYGDEDDLFIDNDLTMIFTSGDYTLYRFSEDLSDLPSYFNLADLGYVSPVKYQGSGGNCWAFAAIAALETSIMKITGQTIDLSEENMKNIASLFSDYGWSGLDVNRGGYPEMAYGYLVSWLGPVFENDDTYDPESSISPLLDSILHVQNIQFLNRADYTDNDLIKSAIMNYGGVYTPVYVITNSGKNYIYNNVSQAANHAVCIVGWNDSYDIPGAPGNGAWIVKNSWGANSGDNGYYYLSYYDQTSLRPNVANDGFVFILNDTIKYDKNYQYDVSVNGYFPAYGISGWYKNIFNATDNEYLAAVSTYFSQDTDWEVFIKVNNDFKLNKSGSSKAGYFTIDLGEFVPLSKGDTFEVIFKIMTVKSAGFPISFGSYYNNKFYSSGMSFWSRDGESWTDFNEISFNFEKSMVACIKAFTVSNLDLITSLNVSDSKFNPIEITAKITNQLGYPISGGKVIFNLSGELIDADVLEGIAKITYNFNKGLNNISAVYSIFGQNYTVGSTTVNVTKYDAEMSADIEVIRDSVFVTVSISPEIDDNITITVADKVYNVKSKDGKAELNLTGLDRGTYEITVSLKSALYDSADIDESFDITVKRTQIVAGDVNIYYGDKFKVKLIDIDGNPLINKKINYTINGNGFTQFSDENGEIIIVYSFNPGVYMADFEFTGDDDYTESGASSVITVSSTFSLPHDTYTLNSQYSVKFIGNDSNPLKNQQVTFVLAGTTYNLLTDNQGVAYVNINLNPGNYNAVVINNVNNETKSQTIKVIPRINANSNMNVYYGSNSYYKVRVYDDYGNIAKGVSVTFKINGNSYSRVTDKNGYASFKISLKPKTYTITAEYKGFKVSNKVVVKSTIVTKDLTKKKAKTVKFQAKLLNSKGKILKSKKITFKFKGKKYTVKTSKNGIAVLKLKNLKKGKYVVYSTYGKLTVKNNIKIK